MKSLTNTEIAKIRTNLNNGVVYCGICHGCGMGQIKLSSDGKYIYYRNFGQSSIKNTNGQLRWLLETIFENYETVVPAEFSEYHANYVPIDKQYKGIDMSRKHPNSYGL